MKRRLLASAVTAALFVTCGAAQAAGPGANMGQHASMHQSATFDLSNWNAGDLRNGISAEALIGTDVRGRNNESIGEVQDIIVRRNGKVRALVISAGGVLGVGETDLRVAWNQVQLDAKLEHVKVPIASQNVDRFRWGAESVHKARGELLASEVMDSSVALTDGMRYGEIDDLVIGRDGNVKGVVVSSDLNNAGFGRYALPFRGRLAYNATSDQYRLPYTQAQVKTLRPLDYSAAGIVYPQVGATGGVVDRIGGFFDRDRASSR